MRYSLLTLLLVTLTTAAAMSIHFMPPQWQEEHTIGAINYGTENGFSRNGKYLICPTRGICPPSIEKIVSLELNTGVFQTFEFPYLGHSQTEISPDLRYAATQVRSHPYQSRILDIETGQIKTLARAPGNSAFCFTSDGNWLVNDSAADRKNYATSGGTDQIDPVVFNPGEQRFAYIRGMNNYTFEYEIDLGTFRPFDLHGDLYSNNIEIVFSRPAIKPRHSWMLHRDGTLHDYDWAQKSSKVVFEKPSFLKGSIGFSPGFVDISRDESTIAILSHREESVITLIEIPTGKLNRKIPAQNVAQIRFSPDGKRLYTFSPNKFSEIDVATGAVLTCCVLPTYFYTRHIDVSTDDSRVLIGTDDKNLVLRRAFAPYEDHDFKRPQPLLLMIFTALLIANLVKNELIRRRS